MTVPRQSFFCGSFLLFVFRVCLLILCSLVVTCWEMVDLLALLCLTFLVLYHFSTWCPGLVVVLDCTDSQSLPSRIFLTFLCKYEGCSNVNASSIITFFTYMLQQNGKRFYKGLYVTFKLAPDLKKNTVYLSSYSPLNEGHVSILSNSMLLT